MIEGNFNGSIAGGLMMIFSHHAAGGVKSQIQRKAHGKTVDEGFRIFLSKLTPSKNESEATRKHRAYVTG